MAGIVTWPYWSPRVTPFVADYLPGRSGDEPPADQPTPPAGEPADELARPADELAGEPEDEAAREQIASLETRISELEETVRQTAVRQEDLAALRQETEALRAQMEALSGRLQDVGPGEFAAVPEQVDQRLSALASEREQLAQHVASLNEQVTGLNERVTKLNEQVTNLNGQVTGLDEQARNLSQEIETGRDAAAVALGLSRLSETIGTSRAYREELDAVKNIAGEAVLDEETLQPLEAHAAAGVSTFTDLYRRFPEMADAVVQAEGKRDDDGLLQTALNRLRSLVSVRRTGEAALEKGGAAATLETARLRLELGDLAGAIDALGTLEGAPASAAGWWLNAARSRLAVQRAMERMQIRALSTLSSREG